MDALTRRPICPSFRSAAGWATYRAHRPGQCCWFCCTGNGRTRPLVEDGYDLCLDCMSRLASFRAWLRARCPARVA